MPPQTHHSSLHNNLTRATVAGFLRAQKPDRLRAGCHTGSRTTLKLGT